MALRHLFLVLVLLWLGGCSLFTSRESMQGPGNLATWKVHRAQVGAINGWQIDGKVGIRTPQDSGSGTLFWLQRLDYYDIRLSGPLGRGAARLKGRQGAVTLETSEGSFESSTPEMLLEERLGWRLPVSHLLWWVRGLPAPDSDSQLTLDSNSHLAKLVQDGWTVDYSNYQDQDGYWLPERLKLHGENLDVTLVLKAWQPRKLGR